MSEWGTDRDSIDWRTTLGETDLNDVLLEHPACPMYVADRERHILFWNQPAAELTGYQWHEMGGRGCHNDMLAHVSLEGVELCGVGCPLQTAIEEGHRHEMRLLLRHKHGHRVPVRQTVVPVRNTDGQVVAVVVFFSEELCLSRRTMPFLAAHGCRDEETGAAVRQYGELRVRQSFDELAAFGVPFGWLRIGVDGIEQLERKLGWAAVSHAVALVARTLSRMLSESDLLVRWNPTEFRVVAANTEAARLMTLGRSLAVAVMASNLRWWGDALAITISLGGAGAEADDSLETLEDRAGEAFEISREKGGNRASFFGWQDSNPFSTLS